MEEIALGCLGWKPDDFLRYSGSDLIKAVNGYAEDQKVKWERIRVQCAYGLLPHYSSTKHGELKFSDIKLPIDPPESILPEHVGTIKKLTKEQVRAEYLRCGLRIEDEDFLDRIFNNKN